MFVHMDMKQKVQRRAADLAASFINDGYICKIKVILPGSCFYKLRHKSNQNIVTLIGTYRLGRVSQYTNGKQKHVEEIK